MTPPRFDLAFITGAGSGIGLRLAERLAASGTRLALLDRTFGDAARARLPAAGPRCQLLEADIRDARAVDEAARLAVTALGAPDLAVNCAGVQRARAFDELPAEDFDLVVDVNLKGSRNFAAALLPRLAPGGSLVLVASLAGLVGNYGYAAYNASKFGVVGLGAALRIEYRPRGLRVTVVCPPEVETPMVAEERLSAPEVTFATKKLAGTVELDELISALLRGAARGDALVVPGLRARATSLLARLAPGMVSRTTDLVVARALRGSGK